MKIAVCQRIPCATVLFAVCQGNGIPKFLQSLRNLVLLQELISPFHIHHSLARLCLSRRCKFGLRVGRDRLIEFCQGVFVLFLGLDAQAPGNVHLRQLALCILFKLRCLIVLAPDLKPVECLLGLLKLFLLLQIRSPGNIG